jgi:hypothetical protein
LILITTVLAISVAPAMAKPGQDNRATITYRLGAGTSEYTLTAEDNSTLIGNVRLSPGESGYVHLEYLPKSAYSIEETQCRVTSTWSGFPSEDMDAVQSRIEAAAGQVNVKNGNYYGASCNAAAVALSYDIPLSNLTYHEEGISPDWLVIAAEAKLSNGQSAWGSGEGGHPGLPAWAVIIFSLAGVCTVVLGGFFLIKKRLKTEATNQLEF